MKIRCGKRVCLGMAAMMTAGMLAGCGESSESKDTAMVQTGEDGVVEVDAIH